MTSVVPTPPARVSEERATPPITRTRTPRKSTERQSPRRRTTSELHVDTEEASSEDTSDETPSVAVVGTSAKSSPKQTAPPLSEEQRLWKAQTMCTWRVRPP